MDDNSATEIEESWVILGFTAHTENFGCYPKNNRKLPKNVKLERPKT